MFSVFAPCEDDLDVCAIDACDILSTDLNSQLPPHHKCAAHLLNLICTTDAAVAKQNHQYKQDSRETFAKCQALWNKTTRSVLAAEVVENESSLQLKRPCSRGWNSVYDAVRRLNKTIELQGSQALCNICQRLDLPRYVCCMLFIPTLLLTCLPLQCMFRYQLIRGSTRAWVVLRSS